LGTRSAFTIKKLEISARFVQDFKDPMQLTEEEEQVLIETIVELEGHNVWVSPSEHWTPSSQLRGFTAQNMGTWPSNLCVYCVCMAYLSSPVRSGRLKKGCML
jgi:hypothetical protein